MKIRNWKGLDFFFEVFGPDNFDFTVYVAFL